MPLLRRLVVGFPPRRPWFEPGSVHVGFVFDKMALGPVLSEYFRFPPPLIPPTAPHSSPSIIQRGYNRPNSGRVTKWTQSHFILKNQIKSKNITQEHQYVSAVSVTEVNSFPINQTQLAPRTLLPRGRKQIRFPKCCVP